MNMKKKIGILTQPLINNYGGILQAYALQKVLEDMGYDVWTLDVPLSSIKKTNAIKRFVMNVRSFLRLKNFNLLVRYLSTRNFILFYSKFLRTNDAIIRGNIIQFVQNSIKIKKYSDVSLIKETDFDALIVGSDQMWRPSCCPSIEIAFFNFARNWKIKKIAYAVSFGTTEKELNEQQICNCRELIRFFDAVSVRENSGVRLCEEYFGVSALQLLDPTFLLPIESYKNIVLNCPQSKGELFKYILDDNSEFSEFVNFVARQRKMKVFDVDVYKGRQNVPMEQRVLFSVETWIKSFSDAKLVITDSFHGCVFSILFKKPFIVIANRSRGLARIDSLLSLFHLEDHFLDDISTFDETKDYSINVDVDRILIEKRMESISFLKINL